MCVGGGGSFNTAVKGSFTRANNLVVVIGKSIPRTDVLVISGFSLKWW